METNFQTSFIPKKPVVAERVVKSRHLGILTVFSLLIFFTMVIGTGALYFYKKTLASGIAQMENDLSLAENRFEPAKIAQLELLNRRLQAGSAVLDRHIAISPIFEALEKVTMKTVRYTKFDYILGEEKSRTVLVSLDGVASNYRSVALQSDLFNQNKYFIDPTFSNLTLDEKGNVTFNLDFTVDLNFVDYQKVLEGTNIPSTI